MSINRRERPDRFRRPFSGAGLSGRRGAPLVLGAVLAALTVVGPGVRAQVLEVGDDGSVKTYDGAGVCTLEGCAPIVGRSHRRHARASLRAVASAAEAADLSPALVNAVAWRESGGRSGLVSRKGALGVMQLMPGTARDLGVDPLDERANLKGGAAYLDRLMVRYDGDLLRALAAYNAGPAAVDRYHGVPPFKETQGYVSAVLERLSEAVVPLPHPVSKRGEAIP